MAQGGLRKWVAEKWVDIGAPKKDGKYQPCGRSKGSKRKYPKCVPIAKARSMSKGQRASAVKRTNKANGGYIGSFIDLNVDGKTYSNPSYKKYYKGLI